MSDFKRRLAKELAESPEYREAYAEGFTNEFITAQMKYLRKQRGLSQAQLGEMIDSNQGRVSLYENKDYGQWNIDTLRRIAAQLGGWLKVSIESYGTLLDEAEKFSGPGLARPAFDDDPVIRRWLSAEDDFGDDVFAPARRLLVEWLSRDTSDFQPLCDWLQGVELPGFTEGEEPYQWILWSLPATEPLRAVLADRMGLLLSDREIDVRPSGWRPVVLLKNLFMLAANLGEAERLQEPLDLAYQRECDHQRETGNPRMSRDVLSALRTAMERNQGDGRWADVWSTFISVGHHAFLPGAAQAGYDGLIHFQPRKDDDSYWFRLADALRVHERKMYDEGRMVPGQSPDAIDELKNHIGTMFEYWSEPSAALWLLKGGLAAGWLQEAAGAWSSAVFERAWETAIQAAPEPLGARVVVDVLVQGADYQLRWNSSAGYEEQASAFVKKALPNLRDDKVRLVPD